MTSGLGKGIEKALKDLAEHGIKVPRPEKTLEQKEREWYEKCKESWFFHPSSWYWRGVNGYDGHGCDSSGCIFECQFYPPAGRLRL